MGNRTANQAAAVRPRRIRQGVKPETRGGSADSAARLSLGEMKWRCGFMKVDLELTSKRFPVHGTARRGHLKR